MRKKQDEDDDAWVYRSLSTFNRSHRSGKYIGEEGKARFGRCKDGQIGLRLAPEELQVAVRVCAHWEVGFSTWVNFSVLRFIEYQRAELLPLYSLRVQAIRAWVPPAAAHAKNVKIMNSIKDEFMQPLGGCPCATAVRWAILDEAARALATPSKRERREAEYELRKSMLAQPHPTGSKVQLLSGNSMFPLGDDS